MKDIPEKIGEYRVVREVGRGATAVVYLAESPRFAEPVAVKHILFRDKARDESKWNRRLLKLLKAEESVASRLDHPHIIRIHEVVVEPDQAYVVMEYFPGESLERYCKFEHLLPIHRAVSIVFKCAMALDYAFRQGVVHRDIKPANILVDEQDNVRITDFGLALNIDKKLESDSTFIMGVGSPAYMSPEQVKGYPLNQKTDLYSLGVVFFHLLTGRLPFRAASPGQLIYKIINADPPDVSRLNPDVPEKIDAVIRRALEKDLYSRYRNGAEFAKDLAAVRYKIVDDRLLQADTSRFALLRKLGFFTEFDDVELWEALRISTWRRVGERTVLMREDDKDPRFGIVLDGEVELSVAGRRVMRLGPDEPFGELAWLDGLDHRHPFSVVSCTATTYLEISPAALALASDEVRELIRTRVATVAAKRLAAALRTLAANNEPALRGDATATGGLELRLVE